MNSIINNKEVNFTFGLYFLGKAQKEFNTDLNGLLQNIAKNPLSDITDLMYYSIKCSAELDEIKPEISKREFVEHLETNSEYAKEDGIIKQWTDKFIESIKGHFLPNDNETEDTESKKKLIGAKT